MAYKQGDVVRDYLTLLDDGSGLPVNDAVWTVVDTIAPDDGDFSLSITGIGNGIYRVQFTADQVGTYYYQVETETTDPSQNFEETFVIEESLTVGAALGTSAYGTTLDELIRMCATEIGDFLEIEATANGASDGSSITAEVHLAGMPSNAFKGSSLWVVEPTSSDNYGIEVRVIDSAEDSRTLTLSPHLPSQVLSGDIAWLTNIATRGRFKNQYVSAINTAIRRAFPAHKIPLSYEYPDTFSQNDPTLALPSHVFYVSGFDILDELGITYPVPMSISNRAGYPGWSYDYGSQLFTFSTEYAAWADGRTVRLSGYGRPAILEDGSDMTSVDAEWIVDRVAATLKGSTGDVRDLASAAQFKNYADVDLPKIVTQVPASTLQVR